MIAKQTTKIGAVEGIRGLACLMVFLSHLSSTFAPSMHTGSQGGVKTSLDMLLHHSPFAFIYSGAAAVGIFFVLSGFILGYAISEKGDVIGNASAMFVKRYFRLMPVALFSSVVAFFIFKYTTADTSELGQWAINYDIKKPSIFDAIYYGSVTPFFSGVAPYNWSLWTMKIEMFGSAIICLLTCILSRINYKKTVILVCMLIPFFMNIKKGDDIYYASFMAGFLIYHFDFRLTPAKSILLFIAGLYLCGFHTTSSFYQWLHHMTSLKIDGRALDNYAFYNNVGSFLVVLSVLKGELLSKMMSIRPIVYMGTLSFSVYALHQPIMHFTCPAIYNAMKSHGFTYGYSALVASVVTVLVCYIVAVPTNKYIDKFSVRLSNNIKRLTIK
ncbi:TPA: acyltransferase [Cronobacter turicensis]|nr:acyltransferase [Cronobacter turicensis]